MCYNKTKSDDKKATFVSKFTPIDRNDAGMFTLMSHFSLFQSTIFAYQLYAPCLLELNCLLEDGKNLIGSKRVKVNRFG